MYQPVTGFTAVLEWRSKTTDSAKSPNRYLDLATECMKRVTSESASSNVKVYHRQCKYLTEELKKAVEERRKPYTRSLSPEHKVECLEALKLLYRLAKEVESFIQECCREDAWVQAALTSASVPGRVCSLGCYLKLCSEVVRNSNKLGAAWLTFTKLEGVGEAELLEVEKLASNDDDNLMRLLESRTPSRKIGTTEADLATILLGRLKSIQAMSSSGSRLSSNLGVWDVTSSSIRQGQKLGLGGFGTVQKSLLFGAVEVAERSFVGWDMRAEFSSEVATLAEISHPNVVTFFGYAMDERSCSIVMELMDRDLGLLMQQRMQEDKTRLGPFSIWEACDIMLQVAEGVHYIHQKRVVHRCLKSSNILVRILKADGVDYVCAKVADFALHKTKERILTLSHPTHNMGSTTWMAPELLTFSSETALNHPFKSDVYSFGMLCYEILTGEFPFSAISPRDARKKAMDGVRPMLPDYCPQNLKNLIELCWDPQPNARPSFAKICEELRYIKCLLLLEPRDEDQTLQPSLPVIPTIDLPGEVSTFKGEYSSLKVVRQLGKGGLDYVTVYLSTWSRPDGAQESVAQKRFMGSRNQCFVNEVSILAYLEHPNVVRLWYYATDRRSCSIVLELMDEDLYDMMHQRRLEGITTPTGPFSIDEALHIILQIAQGMDYVHGKNVVHRDLKSCNILVRKASERGQLVVKVADFGLSCTMKARDTFLGKDSDVGTVRWMAPEVMSLEIDSDGMHVGLSNYDPFKSDVYSFGMVCYEILAGRVPFHNIQDLNEVKVKVLGGGRPALPEWTPSNLKTLVEDCWQKGAKRRPSFGDIIKELTQRLKAE